MLSSSPHLLHAAHIHHVTTSRHLNYQPPPPRPPHSSLFYLSPHSARPFRRVSLVPLASLSSEPGPAIPPVPRVPLEAKLAPGPRHHRLVAFRQELNRRLSELRSHTQQPLCARLGPRLHSSFDLYQLLMTLSEKSRIC